MSSTTSLGIFLLALLMQPTKLQLIEEALDRVLLTHSINYEKGSKVGLGDVTVTYTGNTVIDARQDTDSLCYYVYGTYTYSKYTYVDAPNPMTGGRVGKSYNTTGSTSYLARVKSVLDDYRVQDIIVVAEPEKFVFADAVYDSLKTTSDWIYPNAIWQSNSKKKDD